jgi:hypothetical protein
MIFDAEKMRKYPALAGFLWPKRAGLWFWSK